MIRSITQALIVLLPLFGGAFGAPDAEQDGTTNARNTSGNFRVTQPEAIAAITNTFCQLRYHQMVLGKVPGTITECGRRLTNGWLAVSSTSPLSVVTRGKKMVPYFGEFYLTVEPLASNECKIAVVTLDSWVHDGREIGIHGGWAHHAVHVAPVLQEETNVLSEIARELRWLQEGATNMASTNAPPPRTGLYGMSAEDEALVKAALKAAEAAGAKSSASGQDTNAPSPKK